MRRKIVVGFLGKALVFFALDIAIQARGPLPNTPNDGYQASFCKRNNETMRIPCSKSLTVNIPCKSRNPSDILLYKGSGTSLEIINVNASSPWKYLSSESNEHGLLSGFVYEPAKGSDYNSSMLTGLYTCQFASSSNSKDSITVELYEDSSSDIVLLYENPCEIYQANCTEYIFECVVNKDFFDNMFEVEWYLQRGPDDLTLTTNKYSSESEHNGWFRERIYITFPSTDITGIGCRAKKANYEWSNQTIVNITVTDWNLPELHNTQTETISYVEGLNLTSEYTPSTCSEKSYVRWEVDGNTSEFHKTFDSYGRSSISVSDASVTQNYTISVGSTSKTYLVEPYRPSPTLLVIASVPLWIGLVAVGVLIAYKKIMGNSGILKMIHEEIERRATALRTKLEWHFDERDFLDMVKIGKGQYGARCDLLIF